MKRIAEALVECGYEGATSVDVNGYGDILIISKRIQPGYEKVEPFADTIKGHRQLMALYFYTLFPDKQHVKGSKFLRRIA